MTDWPVKTLGEVCDLVGGGTPSKDRPEFYGGEIPWATVRDLNVEVLRSTEHSITVEAVNSSSSNIIPSGSVVIATRVGLGKAVIVAQDTAINQDLRGLVVKKPKELMAEYLYWWYLSTVHLVVAAGTGATVQGVKLPFVSGLAIPVPPLEEQKRIVALLDAANEHVTELTACYEQSRTHTNNLFTSALRDALESNPGWPVKTLGDLLTVQNGYAFDSQFFSSDGKIGLIRIRDLKSGTDTETRYTGQYDDGYVVSEGDYLIGMDGEFRCYEWQGEPALLNQRVCRLCGFDKSLESRFLFYGINKFLKDIEDVTGYTTVKHLSSKSILAIEMPVPPLEEQKRIVARLDSMKAKTSEMVAAYDAKLTVAKNLRQSILESAFAGDL